MVVALALIANALMAWWTEHRLQTRIAAIRAAGDPASIADLTPKPIPDNENAAVHLARIKPQLDAFAKDHQQFFNSSLGKDYEATEERGEPATAEQIAAIRAIVDKYPGIDRGLAAAAACEQYASPMDFSLGHREFLEQLLEQPADVRTAARFIRWQARVLITDGRSQEAVDRGMQLLRLARLYESEPTMISFLIAIALREIASITLYDALAVGAITAEQHAALDDELARYDDPRRIVRALKSERALNVSAFAQMFSDPSRVLGCLCGWPLKRNWMIGVFDFYDVQIPLAARPWLEAHKRIGKDGALDTDDFGVMAELLLPAIQATYDANTRLLAVSRALRIFNVLRQYAEENGHEAHDLGDVSLPKGATMDPFSGAPLKLKQTDDGWIVYSVMGNGIDDGGDFVELKDYGVAPPRHRSTEMHDEATGEQ